MKNNMLRRLIIYSIIIVISATTLVIGMIYWSNQKIIDYVVDDLKMNIGDYSKIVTLINKLPNPEGDSYHIIKPHGKDHVYISQEYKDDSLNTNLIKKALMKVIMNSDRAYMVKHNYWVSFRYRIHNREFSNPKLIYFYKGTSNLSKMYKDIEVCNKLNIPSRTSNWIYIIDKHWAIYLPEPTFIIQRNNKYSISRDI